MHAGSRKLEQEAWTVARCRTHTTQAWRIVTVLQRQTNYTACSKKYNFLEFLCLFQASLFIPFVCYQICEHRANEPILMLIGRSGPRERSWNIELWGSTGQQVKGQDHTRPQLDLETWRRHRSLLFRSTSFSSSLIFRQLLVILKSNFNCLLAIYTYGSRLFIYLFIGLFVCLFMYLLIN